MLIHCNNTCSRILHQTSNIKPTLLRDATGPAREKASATGACSTMRANAHAARIVLTLMPFSSTTARRTKVSVVKILTHGIGREVYTGGMFKFGYTILLYYYHTECRKSCLFPVGCPISYGQKTRQKRTHQQPWSYDRSCTRVPHSVFSLRQRVCKCIPLIARSFNSPPWSQNPTTFDDFPCRRRLITRPPLVEQPPVSLEWDFVASSAASLLLLRQLHTI